MPKFRKRVTVRGKRTWKDALLFGRYFFVRILDAWRAVFRSPWVSGVLMVDGGDEPGAVGDEFVDGLRSQEVCGYVTIFEAPRFRAGQRVRISSGPLKGLIGIFEESKRNREVVLLSMLGSSQRRVKLKSSQLVAVV
jgi:transcription antitermination factor NusG